ncbi:MAG: DUF1810 domain-containing protein [Pseudomonadota bacterium]
MLDPALRGELARFVAAQDDVYETVAAELRAGVKRGHWMWFVFPQLRGLGRSAASDYYGIGGLAEARAYLDHAKLGPRLLECSQLTVQANASSISEIFPFPDDLKLRSSMTLFEATRAGRPVFAAVLDQYFDGRRDQATLNLLRG